MTEMKESNLNTILELIETNLIKLHLEVLEKESENNSNLDMKDVYLKAAEKVGQAEREIDSMELNKFESYGISLIKSAFRSMRKVYVNCAKGKAKRAMHHFVQYKKMSKWYEELRRNQLS